MFDIGLPELLIILGVALIVLGPQRLPELARSIGKAIAELRRTSDDLRRNVLLGEGLENETPHQAKTAAARTIPQGSTHTKGGDSKEDSPEKKTKKNGTSGTTQLASRDEG